MNVTIIRKRLFGEEAKDAVCSFIGITLGFAALWPAHAITEWVAAPFIVRLDASTFTGKEWDALHSRVEVLALLVLIGFAGSLSRLHPLIGRTLSWVSFYAGLKLFYIIIRGLLAGS
ncbi:MAG: hypothetical protein AB7G62_01280 [Magnetospirillum sp.]